MDVRLAALKQEQSIAFSRAEAAGFDSSNMADILDFSEHFGADRLRYFKTFSVLNSGLNLVDTAIFFLYSICFIIVGMHAFSLLLCLERGPLLKKLLKSQSLH